MRSFYLVAPSLPALFVYFHFALCWSPPVTRDVRQSLVQVNSWLGVLFAP